MTTRWDGESVVYKTFHARVTFDPKTGTPHGVMIRRTDKCTHDIDDDMDELSRQISRLMQNRKP